MPHDVKDGVGESGVDEGTNVTSQGTRRAAAISDVLRVFLATKTGPDPSSGVALVAAVMFDEAKHALRAKEGLTRDQLADKVDQSIDVDQAVDRFRKALVNFARLLPLSGITNISGPTRNQRKDNVPLLWLQIEFVEEADATVSAFPDEALIDETASLLISSVKQLLSKRFSSERIREIRAHLQQGHLLKALGVLLVLAGCYGAIRYYLHTEGKALTAAGETIRRERAGALRYGYWFMWDSTGEALSTFHVLRNGEDITTKVRLFERHFSDGTSYGAEDLSVNPNATYHYAIAHGPKILRHVSLPFRPCRDCLVEKLAAARLAIARGLPVEESSPEIATAKVQRSFGSISVVAYAGQPASFHGNLLPDTFLRGQVDPSVMVANESAWVEVDFGDGPPEIWPQGTLIHTWTRAGRYLSCYRLMDERAAKHSTIQCSIQTVQKRRANQDPAFEFYFMPRDRSSLPAAFANEILRHRLVRAPVGATVRHHIDLTLLSMWPANVRGATLISDYGDGTRRQETIHSANRVDAITCDHIYDHVGLFRAVFEIRSNAPEMSAVVPVYVRIESQANYSSRASTDDELLADSNYTACSDVDVAPLVLMNENELATAFTDVDGGVYFDMANDGCIRKTAWTSAQSGAWFLVLDTGSHIAENGAQLFSEGYHPQRTKNPTHPRDGFDALSEWDDNHDGVIDRQDSIWPRLCLWHDQNHDGVSSPGQIGSIDPSSVRSISLKATPFHYRDGHGNEVLLKSRATLQDEHGIREVPIYAVRFAHASSELHEILQDAAMKTPTSRPR
jgi:hypothetical protein